MTDSPLFSYPGVDPLSPAPAPELVIGVVAPAGARRDSLVKIIANELKEYNYQTEHIKLSDLIPLVPRYYDLKNEGELEPERTHSFMDAGNDIRQSADRGDALSIVAISEIRRKRDDMDDDNGDSGRPVKKHECKAYILDSLKHPDEIRTLRAVYGQGFLLLSGYSRREQRLENLASRIALSRHDSRGADQYKADAADIVKRDYNEEDIRLGQKVQSCFPMADLFVDLDKPEGVQKGIIERYFQIIFNHPYITPTKDEAGMFHAEAASWRSSDLSKQVGASICTDEGDVLALGANEVPKAFGGLYWEGDEGDGRDFQRGKNEGNDQKRLIVSEIFERLAGEKGFSEKNKERLEELKTKIMEGEEDPTLDNLQALNVIEYGRTVHAEMAALSDAAARGIPVKGATMYVNTFPCHICARHIVAAGIKRVVYVEPYPKSLTGRLFNDSIVLEPQSEVANKVVFEAFTGVAPRAYRFSFVAPAKRKDKSGLPLDWRKSSASTKMKRYVTSYLAMENHAISSFLGLIESIKREE